MKFSKAMKMLKMSGDDQLYLKLEHLFCTISNGNLIDAKNRIIDLSDEEKNSDDWEVVRK